MPYQFLTILRRYRDTDTGALVPENTIYAHSAALTEAGGKAMDDLADLFDAGEITAEDYIAGLRDEMKNTYTPQMMLGRGGRDAMTSRDWGTLGGLLSKQYAYHDGFLADLKAGKLSRDQIAARGRLYMTASGEAYERGHAASFGVYFLPAYPKDGSTECVNGCGCRWRFEVLDGEGNVDCYWEIDATLENCETCIARSQAWYPLQIRGGVLQPYEDIRMEAHVHEN